MAHESYHPSLWHFIKTIFIILLFLQFAPSLIEGIKKQYTKYFFAQTQVAVIPINGILFSSSSYSKDLTRYFKDPAIKAIILKIECPGSTGGTGQALFNEVLELKKEYPKPIITLVENICTSGGYYIACATDYIIATGMATVGSVGNYMPNFQLKEFIEQFKIQYTPVKTGAYKTMIDPFSEKTPEEKALLQELSNDVYQQFTEDVAKQRKLPLTNLKDWADGKIFTGRQALKLGLIDELGTAHTVIKVLKEKALLDGEIEWVHAKQSSGLARWFSFGEQEEGTLQISIGSVWELFKSLSAISF